MSEIIDRDIIEKNRKNKLFTRIKEKRANKLRARADRLNPPIDMNKGAVEANWTQKHEINPNFFNPRLKDSNALQEANVHKERQMFLAEKGLLAYDEIDGKWGPQSTQADSLYSVLKGKGYDDRTILARSYAARDNYPEEVLNLLDPANGDAGIELFMYATSENLRQHLSDEERKVLFKGSLPKQRVSGRGDRMIDVEQSDASVEDIIINKMGNMDNNRIDKDKVKNLYGKVGLGALELGRYVAEGISGLPEQYEKVRDNVQRLGGFLGLKDQSLIATMMSLSPPLAANTVGKKVVEAGKAVVGEYEEMPPKKINKIVQDDINMKRVEDSIFGRGEMRQATNQEIINTSSPGELRMEAEESGLTDVSPYMKR